VCLCVFVLKVYLFLGLWGGGLNTCESFQDFVQNRPKSVGNRSKIDEILVSGRPGTILGRRWRQGPFKYWDLEAFRAEKVVQRVPFWKSRTSKMAPKPPGGGKIGTGIL